MSRDEKKRESLFLNKTVRLVKSDGFVLTGKILKMDKNSILFETDQATSLIATNHIKEMVVKKRVGRNEKK
jgi:sRNA-binding regulator protein Hfq